MDQSMAHLQARWTQLYRSRLPALAKARDPAQPHWPVYLDHCFARIVLDNAVGVDKPWTETVKAPAVKNMSMNQLRDAIELAEMVATGERDLVELDERSLKLRGKKGKRKHDDNATDDAPTVRKKRKDETAKQSANRQGEIEKYLLASPSSPASNARAEAILDLEDEASRNALPAAGQGVDITAQISRINASHTLTPFRKKMLRMLCQIPPGRYSTYQAMSDYVTKTSHKTCARAVGSAMRNNPFAPEVPCHRVLANDGSLGGFNGEWGEGGKYANRKHELLAKEGVKFDSRGKVKGVVFKGFSD